MAYDYARERKAAQDGFTKFGAAMIIRRGDTDHACVGLIDGYTALERATSLVQFADQKVLVPADSIPIVPDGELDVLLIDGKTYRIVTVTPLAPGNIPIYFELQVRL